MRPLGISLALIVCSLVAAQEPKLATDKLRFEKDIGPRVEVTASPSGTYAVSWTAKGSAKIWDVTRTPPLLLTAVDVKTLEVVSWASATDRLAMSDGQSSIWTWTPKQSKNWRTWSGISARYRELTWDRTGNRLLALDLRGQCWLLDMSAKAVPARKLNYRSRLVTAAAWRPTGGLIALARPDGTIELFNVVDGTRSVIRNTERRWTLGAWNVAWSPDGAHLASPFYHSCDLWTLKSAGGRVENTTEVIHRANHLTTAVWVSNQDVIVTDRVNAKLLHRTAADEYIELPGQVFPMGEFDRLPECTIMGVASVACGCAPNHTWILMRAESRSGMGSKVDLEIAWSVFSPRDAKLVDLISVPGPLAASPLKGRCGLLVGGDGSITWMTHLSSATLDVNGARGSVVAYDEPLRKSIYVDGDGKMQAGSIERWLSSVGAGSREKHATSASPSYGGKGSNRRR